MRVLGNLAKRNDVFRYELHREIYCIETHIHYQVELCVLREGEMHITVNGKTETAKSGQCILIYPFQEHSYLSEMENVFALYTFSPSFVAEFMKKTEGMTGERAVFDISELTLEILKKRLIYERDFSLYNIKACLYFMISDYTSQVKMIKDIPEGSVIDKLIYYLNKNYTSQCTLSEAAEAIGYSEKYISKCIKNTIGVNFCSLVNSMRIEHSKFLIAETESSILEIALECGFNDIRSLQRNFKKMVGISPSEYREKTKLSDKIEPQSQIFPKSYFGIT